MAKRQTPVEEGQGVFEYVLLIAAMVLFVILAAFTVQTGVQTNSESANRTSYDYQSYLSWQGGLLGPGVIPGGVCVARWSFDNSSASGDNNTYIVDALNGYANLTIQKPATTYYDTANGKFGNGLEFQASSSDAEANVTNTTGWPNGSAFAVSFWLIPQPILGGDKQVLSSSTLNLSVLFNSDTDQLTVVSFYGPAANVASAPLTSDARHHLVFQRQNDVLSVYVNGRLSDTQTANGNLGVGAPSTPFGLGKGANPSAHMSIDELAVYDRALTTIEISNLYHSTEPGCG